MLTSRPSALAILITAATVTITLLTLPRTIHAQSPFEAPPEYLPDDHADDEADQEVLERTENRVNLRLGVASSDDNGRPAVCLEVRAVLQLSIEGCGTGSGILHDSAGGELAHFRAKWAVDRRTLRGGVLQTQLGIGLAELQVDADQAGFVINPDPGGVEAVGPEASVGVQWMRALAGGWEIVMNANAGLSWIPGASDLRGQPSSQQPFVGFEIGAGW